MDDEPEILPYGEIGLLEYDPVKDGLLCHFCGRYYRNLAQHARLAHNIEADEYRELAGLNRSTRLYSPGLRQRLSRATKPLIARLRARGKLKRWDEDPAKLAANKADALDVLRGGLAPEARRHRRESWTETRRQQRAEQTRQRNLSGELRAPRAAISAGLRRYFAAHPEAVDVERLRRQAAQVKGRKRSLRSFICTRCGQPFECGCPRAKYCPACRPTVTREYNTDWARRKRQRKQAQD